jgi:hypothetical protein
MAPKCGTDTEMRHMAGRIVADERLDPKSTGLMEMLLPMMLLKTAHTLGIKDSVYSKRPLEEEDTKRSTPPG